eukprot:TRINITY_DN61805_c0_g1_i1.p1 TRINITY_DN61805_c0_g1~~TRINITY_DN61805_c0_g1_i1.p1  ORF type:complete len:133 (+),score=0.84 TRINITY_DN61805_c0_g1_i1:377-775(+)
MRTLQGFCLACWLRHSLGLRWGMKEMQAAGEGSVTSSNGCLFGRDALFHSDSLTGGQLHPFSTLARSSHEHPFFTRSGNSAITVLDKEDVAAAGALAARVAAVVVGQQGARLGEEAAMKLMSQWHEQRSGIR